MYHINELSVIHLTYLLLTIKMPLPAALQARLQKRGFVKAELEHKDEGDAIADDKLEEVAQIPPKKNYKQTPLPPGWFQVPDPQSKREYYWNVHTNQVSWRHPLDPMAEITYPASWQQKSEKDVEEKEKNISTTEDTNTKTDVEKKDDKTKSKVKTGKHPSLLKAQRQKEKVAPYRKSKNANDDLDPMDPAAYSDIGRGTWSSGLKDEADQKSGVDTTANGPLFQQRPYPSPGDILRRNKKNEANKDDDD